MDILGFEYMLDNNNIDVIYNSMYRTMASLRDFILNGQPNENYANYDDLRFVHICSIGK